MEISDIDASLSKGRIFSKDDKIIFYTIFAVALCLFVPAVIILALISANAISWDSNLFTLWLLLGIVAVVAIIICGLSIVKISTMNAKITLWLEDAVRLKGYAKAIDIDKFNEEWSIKLEKINLTNTRSIKIEVVFQYDNKKHCRASVGRMLGGGPQGYHTVFAKYADKEIDILYSPKYDEVLILKQKLPNKVIEGGKDPWGIIQTTSTAESASDEIFDSELTEHKD